MIIASQANQACALLSEDESEAMSLLSKVSYEKSEVVVHSDSDLVPRRERDRAPVNFLVDKTQGAPMASICLNDFHGYYYSY